MGMEQSTRCKAVNSLFFSGMVWERIQTRMEQYTDCNVAGACPFRGMQSVGQDANWWNSGALHHFGGTVERIALVHTR